MAQKQYSIPYTTKIRDLECSAHGQTTFLWEVVGKRYRCRACNTAAIYKRKQRVKATLVAEAGGACTRCGYNRSMLALHFHHLDPALKEFSLSKMTSKSLSLCRAEAAKCQLLCANCHAEVEGGLRMGKVGLEPTVLSL